MKYYYKVYINGVYIANLYKALAYEFAKIADVSTTTIITEGSVLNFLLLLYNNN